jgi:integrase
VSVRKRTWTTRGKQEDGTPVSREAWIVDYVDQNGKRHIKSFKRKKEADAYHATVQVDVAKGVHTAPSQSITVERAAENWLTYVELEGRERSTLAQYRTHLNHINPRFGSTKLAKLTTPLIHQFRDDLVRDLSRPLASKVLVSLKSILKDARRRGNIANNPAEGVSVGADKRGKRKLKVGVDIPAPAEIRRILDAADPHWRAILVTAAFTGLRASELRGLPWANVDLTRHPSIHVRQRADAWGKIGRPKSAGSERNVPIGPFLVNVLKQWKLKAGQQTLVFPAADGGAENIDQIVRYGFWKAQTAADVTVGTGAKARPKYQGLHALRHFYASWCINRRQDGGLELPLKMVQERLGHASITLTADTYGHLFPAKDDSAELAAAEQALLHAT